MEVAGTDDEVLIGADGGIVGGTVNLSLNHALDIADGVLDGAMHLRHATERVGILHVHLGLGDEFAALEQLLDAGSGLELALVGTHQVDGLGERLDASVIGFERHGADAVGPVAEFHSVQHSPHGERTHVLGAVEQCQALFAGQMDRLPALGTEHLGTGDDTAVHLDLAQTHQGQAQVCQRHQVARCAERALTIDDGADALVEEVNQALDGVELAARVAIAERLHLEQNHDAHYLVGHALTHTAGMRLHQVDLQLRQLVLALVGLTHDLLVACEVSALEHIDSLFHQLSDGVLCRGKLGEILLRQWAEVVVDMLLDWLEHAFECVDILLVAVGAQMEPCVALQRDVARNAAQAQELLAARALELVLLSAQVLAHLSQLSHPLMGQAVDDAFIVLQSEAAHPRLCLADVTLQQVPYQLGVAAAHHQFVELFLM